MLAVLAIRAVIVGGPQFFNDSYQYLSIARNLETRGAIETSIVHFDEERARGTLPAPETTFPPGYPALLAASGELGLPFEWGGLLLGVLASLSVLALLRAGASAVGASPTATRLALLLWAASAQATLYGITLYAEAVFTAAITAALVLLLLDAARDPAPAPGPSWRLPAAFLLAGGAVALRYAGLFVVAALHAYALARVLRERRRIGRWMFAVAACDVPILLLALRNHAVAGTWLGGNSRPVRRTVAAVAHDLGVSAYELAFGAIRDPRALPFGLLALALCAALAGAVVLRVREARAAPGANSVALRRLALPVLVAATYCAAMAWAGLRTQISLSARMFVPLLPALALLAGTLLAPAAPRAGRGLRALLAVFAAAYAAVNLQASLGPQRLAEHRWVAAALAAPATDGRPLAEWIDARVPAGAPLLAIEGQATGYVLGRPTVSAPGRLFTDVAWTEEETRTVATRFGVRFVIVFPEVVASGGVDRLDSPLFRALAERRPPAWLTLAAESSRAMVYRVSPLP